MWQDNDSEEHETQEQYQGLAEQQERILVELEDICGPYDPRDPNVIIDIDRI